MYCSSGLRHTYIQHECHGGIPYGLTTIGNYLSVINLAMFQVWMDLYTIPVPESGGKTCSQIFEDAGCDTPASPSCGACMGGPRDTHARLNEPQVSFTNASIKSEIGKLIAL